MKEWHPCLDDKCPFCRHDECSTPGEADSTRSTGPIPDSPDTTPTIPDYGDNQ